VVTRLHIVGCGRAARTLARLWHEAGLFEIGALVNRSLESSQAAAAFIGAGRAAETLPSIAAGDWLMLGLPDAALAKAAVRLGKDKPRRPALAFHLSGAERAEALRPLAGQVAAVHPVCPFADPEHARTAFAGSFALGEGDPEALDMLLPCFEAIGARCERFAPRDKRLYHAATIAASNFLNVLDDLALRLAEAGGLERSRALPLLAALQRNALASIERAGPEQSLTGPIERGDVETLGRLRTALARKFGAAERDLFDALGRAAADLAARKHGVHEGRAGPMHECYTDRDGEADHGGV